MLEKNIRIETFIKFLDAKARIIIWKTETEKLFDGYVYQLYDITDYKDLYIADLLFDIISGISVMITEKRHITNLKP